MLFAHDTEMSLQSAVALVNSAGDTDTLASVADLDEFYESWMYTGNRRGDESELAEVRAIRAELRRLLTSDRDTAAELVNRVLADAGALPRLVRHGTLDWHIHAEPRDASLATQIRVETAMAMVDLIRSDELSRLDLCADPTCDGVVLDLSRNRSRRFCSTACGNRVAVAAYRARRA